MIYNFRFNRSKSALICQYLNEQNLLLQGWGGGNKPLSIEQPGFVQQCKSRYKLRTTRVASNLRRVRDFKADDLLVTPHLPENGKVSIHIVTSDYPDCYTCLSENPGDDLNHAIAIKQSYGLNGNIDIHSVHLTNWRAKLPWLRLPILPIPNCEDQFRQILSVLDSDSTRTLKPSDLDEYFMKLRADLVSQLECWLQKIPASGGQVSFETVCRRVLEWAGYTSIKPLRRYNREGGDIDLECTRELGPFESGETSLIVQVKKHEGETGVGAVDQVLGMVEERAKQGEDVAGCVISLARKFSAQAEDKATNEGIALVNGNDLCKLLLEQVSRSN